MSALLEDVKHRYHWNVDVIVAVAPPNTAEFPEIEASEFMAGELGEFKDAGAVIVGAGPTGPSAAE